MQSVAKKTGRKPLHPLWLLAALAALTAAILVIAALNRPEAVQVPDKPDLTVQLIDLTPGDVTGITIHRSGEAPWTAVPHAEDALTILGEDGFSLTPEESQALLQAACCISAEEVLTDDPAQYASHLADFGLEDPRYAAAITYRDGRELTLRVGDKGPDGLWRYMTIDGDDRLLAFSNGSVEGLFVNRDTLRRVSQPDLHKARIDRITLTGPDSLRQWVLRGAITDADAADKWHITQPFAYPADAGAMADLLTSIANIRLGAYVGPATAENLSRCGFDEPRVTIEVHMAAGAIGVTNAEGAVDVTDYPAATLTFIVGGEKTDMVDYIRFGGDIYISSHFTLGVFMDYDVRTTMSRYPVMTALGNLAALTIEENGTVTEFALTRTEQVAANNELITDEEGQPVCDVAVTRNGEAIDYAAFQAAYNALTLVTVSGTLPADESFSAPHTVYTFTDVDGTVHTVALATFDVLHDAVIVDGHAAFYLIKGGFSLTLD